MCGITVIISKKAQREYLSSSLELMGEMQAHRGPDHQAYVIEPVTHDIALGLGNQRLAIQDLSKHGNQPMESPCGRYVIVYNGEIYNFRELSQELVPDDILKKTYCDTAVALASIIKWDVDAFNKFNGMWAIAFYDRKTKRLLISRDRLGIKPLYWCQTNSNIYFASEIKAILAVANTKFYVNKNTIFNYLTKSITNSTQETFFKDIETVPQGSYLEFIIDSDIPKIEFCKFWLHPYEYLKQNESREYGDPSYLWELLINSVGIRMRSDVPVGILLSGGLDSSALLAAASESSSTELTALSIISNDPKSNEEPYIDLMAKYIGCKQIKVQIDLKPESLLSDLEYVCWFSDQPVGGFSAVAHRRLMEQAREHGLTVLITGQGADEQLGGYNKYLYFYLIELIRRGRWVKAIEVASLFALRGTVFKEFTIEEAKRYLPGKSMQHQRAYLGAALLDCASINIGIGGRDYQEREYLDMKQYSVPMLLHYEDRMSMSCSREVRVPFLDYRIIEYLAQLPVDQKIKRGWTKWILRNATAGKIPEAIRWRKDKKGFNIPEKEWARKDFYESFMERFSDDMLAGGLQIVKPPEVRKLYRHWLNGARFVSYKDIFSIYCLETWLQKFSGYLKLDH